MIKLYNNVPNGEEIKFESFIFKGGEQHVKLLDTDFYSVKIKLFFEQSSDLIQLALITDALRRTGTISFCLDIPYFPAARQDRVCNEGEPLSIKVYADFINNLKFDKVYIFDPHSDVTPSLINNVVVVNNHRFVSNVLNFIPDKDLQNIVLVSPDAGSNKKIYDLGKRLRLDYDENLLPSVNVIRADKLRDISNGKIIETVVYTDSLFGKIALIVDDICSYGGTFCALAEKLKKLNADKVYLVVSHFEGVADLQKLQDFGIDKVFTTNSKPWDMNDYNKKGFIEIYDIDQYL